MPKKLKIKNNQKYMIVAAAIGLAVVGYFGYRQIIKPADINFIGKPGTDSRYKEEVPKVTRTEIKSAPTGKTKKSN